MKPINLKFYIYRRGLRQSDVALRLGMCKSQLCEYLAGKRPLNRHITNLIKDAANEVHDEKQNQAKSMPLA